MWIPLRVVNKLISRLRRISRFPFPNPTPMPCGKYVASQREHHRKKTFQDEYRAFLKRHNVAFGEGCVWD